MKLDEMRLCDETKCQELFKETYCPKCGSTGTLLTNWLPPMCSAKERIGRIKAVDSTIILRKHRGMAHA